ncbi:MAG: hypothetical protein VB049_04930 [Candidatus Pelethousia sp.]|nr:hypothetical protein [Candidatus Pelethousia sp.]
MNPLTTIFTAAFLHGVTWHRLQQAQAGQIAEACLKADEEIVCRNATVMMDSRGHISYINNDRPPVVLPTGEEGYADASDNDA